MKRGFEFYKLFVLVIFIFGILLQIETMSSAEGSEKVTLPMPKPPESSSEKISDNLFVRELKSIYGDFKNTMKDGFKPAVSVITDTTLFVGGKLAWLLGASDWGSKIWNNLLLGFFTVLYLFIFHCFLRIVRAKKENDERIVFWKDFNKKYFWIFPVFLIIAIIPILNQIFRIITFEFVWVLYRGLIIALIIALVPPILYEFQKINYRIRTYNKSISEAAKYEVEKL